MYLNSVAVLFLIIFVCRSYEASATENPSPIFHDGEAIIIKATSLDFEGGTSLRAVINPNATIQVILDTSSVQNAGFVIFQVHSYMKPLVLSSSPTLVNDIYVNGTDIGLYYTWDSTDFTFYIFNNNSEKVNLMLVPMLHGSEDPVPGGCNQNFSVSVAPFLTLTHESKSEVIQVDAQAASFPNQTDCDPSGLTYEVYELPLISTTLDSYFDGILSVVTAKGAQLKGLKTPKSIHQPELQHRFALYPGYATIYVVTVNSAMTGKSSAYIPIAKYNCINGNTADCTTYGDTMLLLLIIAVIFVITEIVYLSGRDTHVFMCTVLMIGSVFTFEPDLPSNLAWIAVAFYWVTLLVYWCGRWTKCAFDVVMNYSSALVWTHVFFGLAHCLGLISPFQDWHARIWTFGKFFVVLFIIRLINCILDKWHARNRTFGKFFALIDCTYLDIACGIFIILSRFSVHNNGILLYAYVDPARILRREFSDVIFSPPPLSSTDTGLLISLLPLSIAYVWVRKFIRRRSPPTEDDDIGSRDSVGSDTKYGSI